MSSKNSSSIEAIVSFIQTPSQQYVGVTGACGTYGLYVEYPISVWLFSRSQKHLFFSQINYITNKNDFKRDMIEIEVPRKVRVTDPESGITSYEEEMVIKKIVNPEKKKQPEEIERWNVRLTMKNKANGIIAVWGLERRGRKEVRLIEAKYFTEGDGEKEGALKEIFRTVKIEMIEEIIKREIERQKIVDEKPMMIETEETEEKEEFETSQQ